MLNDYRTYNGVLPYYNRAKVMLDMEVKGRYGYISLNRPLIEGTIFGITVKGEPQYKVRKSHIQGEGIYNMKISRCFENIGSEDEEILKKGTIIKIQYSPIPPVKPAYI